ncbi:MAG: hypothetical protein IBX50_15460 [Marinospirillum sp.]|uniref:hypothetical protein n=1 Tax=Marinospirillum sp. TaxID=2183934 RepID=UPI0019E4D056|nr:hypothetical protein [Marinospirillum sp.]MBE0508086.1 hypothetical protein [Marinospirillum sp.]
MASQLVINRNNIKLIVKDQQLHLYSLNQLLGTYCLGELDEILYLVGKPGVPQADLNILQQFGVTIRY